MEPVVGAARAVQTERPDLRTMKPQSEQPSKLKCPQCGPTTGALMVQRVRRSDGAPFWGCERFPLCKATHGAHPDGKPLGIPGTVDEKAARRRAHEAFDKLWNEGGMRRAGAYAWLAQAMGLTSEQAHIGAFGVEQCARVVELATAKLQSIRNDPLRGDKDQIRALLAERFGHNARRRSREWLGEQLGLGQRVDVHAMTAEQCKQALAILDELGDPLASQN